MASRNSKYIYGILDKAVTSCKYFVKRISLSSGPSVSNVETDDEADNLFISRASHNCLRDAMSSSNDSLVSDSDLIKEHEYASSYEERKTFNPRMLNNSFITSSKARYIIYTVALLSLAVVFYILGFLSSGSYIFQQSLPTSNRTDCGTTVQQARANGCILDFIAGAWVHPNCYDKNLESEFLSLSDWHWYYDAEGQEDLSEMKIRETGGPDPLYVRWDYHDLHCAYTWKKLHRAVIGQKPIDSHIGSMHHTDHCSTSMIEKHNISTSTGAAALSRFFHIFTSCDLPHTCKWLPLQCLVTEVAATNLNTV